MSFVVGYRDNKLKLNDKQEILSRQQKFAKNGPEMYLLIELSPILVILRFDDGHSPDQKNVRRWNFEKP